ncbi:MAG: hypothetical protein ACR2NU_07475 [Aeoliella sp.]
METIDQSERNELRLEELVPKAAAPLRIWIDALFFQDVLDRALGYRLDNEFSEFSRKSLATLTVSRFSRTTI